MKFVRIEGTLRDHAAWVKCTRGGSRSILEQTCDYAHIHPLSPRLLIAGNTCLSPTEPARRGRGLSVTIFALATLASAFLLFWIEPLFARMVLPLLGGSPAVWNTCLMYFQALLLAGYLYVHATTRYLSLRTQIALHLVLFAACIALLPVVIPRGWTPPASASVIGWLLMLLTVALGAPFIVLSATAPLLQRWLAGMGRGTTDPYVLYASSNAGSFFGLLAFPFLLEPNLRLGDQSSFWSAGFVLVFALVACCALIAWRSTPERADGSRSLDEKIDATPWILRLKWVALAFVPSSLLLAVTTFLSTDVAAVPLLWVVPLCIYLLSFVIVFSTGRNGVPFATLLVHAILVSALVILFFGQISIGFRWAITLHLGMFAFAALVLHGELAASRPDPRKLTEYYLWMSLGGALGGAFTALIAPLLVDSTTEYLSMAVVACFLRPTGQRLISDDDDSGTLTRFAVTFVPALLVAVAAAYGMGGRRIGGIPMIWPLGVVAGIITVWFSRNAIRFGASLAAIVSMAFVFHRDRETLYSDRSFFGSYRVTQAGPANFLYHGTTIHGAQYRDSARSLRPLTYYHPNGPVGQIFEAFQPRLERANVGVVGLGAGTMLCYSRPGQNWTFFEIDPHVEAIARDRKLFTYLANCDVKPNVVIGDARLTIAREPRGRYSLLVLDAFSSDAIPVHLLTREAIALYMRTLADHGLLLVHISNRRLELEGVVAANAADAKLAALLRDHDINSREEGRSLEYSSEWVVLARTWEDLQPLAGDARWRKLQSVEGVEPWTDDYSNLFSIVKW